MKEKKVVDMILMSSFSAIVIMLALVPNIGYITFIPGFASLTIIHIPVIIGLMVLGFKQSVGLFTLFGVTSFVVALWRPGGPVDYAFQNPLISILPRVIVGFISYGAMVFLKKLMTIKTYGSTLIFMTVSLVTVLFLYFAGRGLSLQLGWNLNVVTPIMLVISVLVIGVYYFQIEKRKDEEIVYVPATFILSSMIHSLIVLTFLATITVKLPVYDDSQNIIQMVSQTVPEYFETTGSALIYGSLGTSSLIEALLAVIIGTPIVIALKNYQKRDI
ncbi:MAG: hypothetical protein RBQ95_02145 [Paracholeplasma sp.]|nr:hypothetical protein [Paracholeplasma sp.]MDY3195637.1 hypothetical protein [Paracholeplasma sp.]